MSKAYSEKLRDPRWQKKRLEILERDEWTCQLCFDTENTLNVHHKVYEKGKEPWDIDNNKLVTLCEQCHAEEKEYRPGEEQFLLRVLRERGFFSVDLNGLTCGFMAMEMDHLPEVIATVLGDAMQDKATMEKLVSSYFKKINKKSGK